MHFVEIKEEYPNAPAGPKTSRHGTAGYVVEPEKSRLTLINAPVDSFTSSDTVVTADGEYYGSGASVPMTESKYHLPVKTDYQHLKNSYIALSQARNNREFTVTRAGSAVQVDGNPVNTRVPAGQNAEVANKEVSVRLAGADGSVSLQQRIQVRNHGQVTVFGHENYSLLPPNSADSDAQARVESLLALAEGQLSKIEGAELLAVPKSLGAGAGGNGGE